MPNEADFNPLSEEVLTATEAHAAAMIRYLKLPPQVRLAVDRQINAAAVFLGRDNRGEMPGSNVYETAQRLVQGLRASKKAGGT